MRFARLAAVLIVPAGLVLAGPVAAQEASPTPLPAATCNAEPISYESLVGLIATPAATAVPDTGATPFAVPTLPAGEPADEATTTAVRATIDELVACLNEGNTFKILSLYSDRFVQENLGGLEITKEQYDQEVANTAAREPGQQVVIYSYSDVVVQPDGRAAVLVLGDDQSSPNPPSSTLFYLVEQNGRWLVDGTVETATE